MALWDSVKRFLKREAADVKDGFEDLRDNFEAELTRREDELAAAPSERLDMIKEDIEASADAFDNIEAKVNERMAAGNAVAELDTAANSAPPSDDDETDR